MEKTAERTSDVQDRIEKARVEYEAGKKQYIEENLKTSMPQPPKKNALPDVEKLIAEVKELTKDNIIVAFPHLPVLRCIARS